MRQALLSTFFRYCLTGLLAACLDLSLYALLFRGMGVWYLAAHTLSRMVGGATGFILNRSWTFGWSGREELPAHLLKFGCSYLLSYAASSWLLYLFVERLQLSPVPAKMAAEGSVFLLNFLILSQWTFRGRPQLIGSAGSFTCSRSSGVEGGWGQVSDGRHA